MDPGQGEVYVARSSYCDSKEAPNSSAHSAEPSRGRRGRRGRGEAAVTSPDSCDSRRSSTGRCSRVLRARGGEAGGTSVSKSFICATKPDRPLPKDEARSKKQPDTRISPKKPTVKKASKHSPAPKLSKSRRSRGRPSAQASHTTLATGTATTCKPETETEASWGEDTGALKACNDNVADAEDADRALDEDPQSGHGSDDCQHKPKTKMEKSKERATVQQHEVKKEELGEEEGRNSVRKRGRHPKDDKAPRQPKRRKKPPVQYVRCEMEGCGTVLAHPRYLQHHIKYQHLLKKNYACNYPSCGRLFRLQKQLLRHAKHHTDQRDYICEFCARAFKSSHNLAVHRMIHTGEKPIQCEICGFTCRQKASLNWHMKKHDAEASYQFSCSICGKKFEKKDSVVAHKAKSHPKVLIAEALASNGDSVVSSPALVSETAPLAVSQESEESKESRDVADGTLTPLQQVVLPLAPPSQTDASQGQFLQLPVHHVVQLDHQQQAHTLLHLTAIPPPQLSITSSHQLIQLPILPASTAANPQSALLTLGPVIPALAPQQDAQWGREGDEAAQIPGEGELWQRVIVDTGHEQVGEMMWESNREGRKEDEGIVWGREGERQILLQCAEIHGDNLI